MNTDPSGHFVISFSAIAISMLIGFAIGATVSGTVAIIEEVYNDGNWITLEAYFGVTSQYSE